MTKIRTKINMITLFAISPNPSWFGTEGAVSAAG